MSASYGGEYQEGIINKMKLKDGSSCRLSIMSDILFWLNLFDKLSWYCLKPPNPIHRNSFQFSLGLQTFNYNLWHYSDQDGGLDHSRHVRFRSLSNSHASRTADTMSCQKLSTEWPASSCLIMSKRWCLLTDQIFPWVVERSVRR